MIVTVPGVGAKYYAKGPQHGYTANSREFFKKYAWFQLY